MSECDGDNSSCSAAVNCDNEVTIQRIPSDQGEPSPPGVQFFEAKRLKFGIDNILSSEGSSSDRVNHESA